MSYAILLALGVCLISAILEGLFAGKGVKERFAKLRLPRYSLPLWAWASVGALYYIICFILLYRILENEDARASRNVALGLVLVMMGINAFWNYVFFRMRDLFLSFVAFIPYNLVAISLFICLLQFDSVAAWALMLYSSYLIYANWWAYALLKLNEQRG